MFSRKKKQEHFDLIGKQAVLHCSICNGEQVAGFKDLETGKFEEVMLIRNPSDLEEFKRKYGVKEVTKEY
ncbi:MAG: aspartate dehydrogenase [Catonella sp.]|nr:aspartate dehydrogenase [Catonella sp.]